MQCKYRLRFRMNVRRFRKYWFTIAYAHDTIA